MKTNISTSKNIFSWAQFVLGFLALGLILYLLFKVDITNPEQDRHHFVLGGIIIFSIFSVANILGGIITRVVKYGLYIGGAMSLGSFIWLYIAFYK